MFEYFMMAKRIHIFCILILIGSLLLPMFSYAAGVKCHKSCCDVNKEVKKASCCSKSKAESKSTKKHCEGKCNACQCDVQMISAVVFLNQLQ